MESISSENLPIVLHTLNQIELAIDRLQERTQSVRTVDDFLSTPGGMEKLDAACMVLIAIGESIKNLDKVSEGKLLPTYPSIPWKKVMGIRDIMAHHYFEVGNQQGVRAFEEGYPILQRANLKGPGSYVTYQSPLHNLHFCKILIWFCVNLGGKFLSYYLTQL